MQQPKTNFLTGAMILATAGMIARFIGLLYRIPLSILIGDEGIGLYQMAYPIYGMLMVIAVSGVPIALAKLISEQVVQNRWQDALRIFRVAKYFSLLVGLIFAGLLIIFAQNLVELMNYDPRSYYSIIALAPAIPIVSVMAAYRGFFMGMQQMMPTAISQVLEQIVRMITMVVLVYYFLADGLAWSAAGAAFGAFVGAIFGYLTMLYYYYRLKRERDLHLTEPMNWNQVRDVLKQIFHYAIPVTIGALVFPLMGLADALIVPTRLGHLGLAQTETTSLYGQLTGVALILVNFPGVITTAIRSSLVPAISTAHGLHQQEQIERQTGRAFRVAMVISLPAATGLFVLAEPLCRTLFTIPEAGGLVQIVAWSVIFISLQQISSGILQGINEVQLPVRNLFIGAGVNGVVNFILTGMPAFGIRGAAFGTMLGFAVAATLNIYSLKKQITYQWDLTSVLWKPLFATVLMGGMVHLTYYQWLTNLLNWPGPIALVLAVLVGVATYLGAMILIGGIRKDDLKLLPLKPLTRRFGH